MMAASIKMERNCALRPPSRMRGISTWLPPVIAFGEIVVFGEEELRGVGVGVENDGGEVKFPGVVGGAIGDGGWRKHEDGENASDG